MYAKQTWLNGPGGNTAITAAALSHMEDGILNGNVPYWSLLSLTNDYTLADPVAILICHGTITVHLTPLGVGRFVTIKNASVGDISVIPTTGTIDGDPNFVISSQWESHTYIFDGSNWFNI